MRAEKAKIKATFRTEHSVHQRQAAEDGSSRVLPETMHTVDANTLHECCEYLAVFLKPIYI